MCRRIGAMIQPFVFLGGVVAWAAGVPALAGEGITATVGVTPSCPYGLAG
jgi:hypothetical protein